MESVAGARLWLIFCWEVVSTGMSGWLVVGTFVAMREMALILAVVAVIAVSEENELSFLADSLHMVSKPLHRHSLYRCQFCSICSIIWVAPKPLHRHSLYRCQFCSICSIIWVARHYHNCFLLSPSRSCLLRPIIHILCNALYNTTLRYNAKLQ